MIRIAIFVEGQTEQIFVTRLVKEILGNDISVILKRSLGGSNAPKQEIVRHVSIAKKAKFHILINDCGADNRVKSEILENIESLENSNYKCIIGLRDLYPLSEEHLPKLKRGLNFLPHKYISSGSLFEIIIAVQEIETWFLAETHHLARVDKRLNNGSFIKQHLGFNPYTTDVSMRKHPSQDLNNIYKLVGKSYTKRYWQIQKLVNRLDYQNLLRNIRYEIPSLGELITIIESIKKQ